MKSHDVEMESWIQNMEKYVIQDQKERKIFEIEQFVILNVK